VPVPPTADFSARPERPATLKRDLHGSLDGGNLAITRALEFRRREHVHRPKPSHDYTLPRIHRGALGARLDGSETTETSAYIQVSSSAVPPTAVLAIPVKADRRRSTCSSRRLDRGTSPITALSGFRRRQHVTARADHSSRPWTYTVTLGVMTADGSDRRSSRLRRRGQPPAAALSGTPTTGFAPLDVQFTTGPRLGITRLGLGLRRRTTSLVANPLHTFDVRDVIRKLKVTNACSEEACCR